MAVTTSNSALQEQMNWRKPRGSGRTVAALVALAFALASGSARAQNEDPTAPAQSAAVPALPANPVAPPPANPALDLRTPTQEQPRPSVFRRWWFWTAVGAAAAATVVIIVVSSRGHAPPATDLGNQEFQP